ncbi:hypothetical protein [Fodinicurvata halophila]|uniref:hypothetical protein n=1 Tax=Fodinicurvata halophila TaxID=1419723 RepID=UPI0036349168
MDFLEPYLEDALSNANEDIEVDVGDTYLAWSGSASRFGIRARDWRVYDDQDRLLASFPSADVVFSLTELLHGRIAPVEIDIMNASVNLIRGEEGDSVLGPWVRTRAVKRISRKSRNAFWGACWRSSVAINPGPICRSCM